MPGQWGPGGNGFLVDRDDVEVTVANTKSTGTVALVQRDQSLLAGVQKDLANQSFTVQDKPCTTQDVVNVLQGRISKGQAVIAARAALAAAVKAFLEERTSTKGFVSAFRSIVHGMFTNPATLADFGLEPRKSTKKTLETKVTAAEKTAATRTARGTKGPKEKAKIKGAVPATAPATKPTTPTA
jgi:hypothetical protein